MDETYDLTTPEQVDLAYDVAGLGSRSIASLIDTLIQLAAIAAIVLVAIPAAGGMNRVSRSWSGGDGSAESLVLGLAILAIFVVNMGYYIFFEMASNGQSPGKSAAGIRVLSTGGQPITLSQSLIRNLVRLVDVLPTAYLVGAIVMLLNTRSQRLGDLAADTLVVKERREAEPRILARLAAVEQLPPQAALVFGAEDVALARDFLLRCDELPPARREALAALIAGRLRARLAPASPPEPAEAFLARVATLRR